MPLRLWCVPLWRGCVPQRGGLPASCRRRERSNLCAREKGRADMRGQGPRARRCVQFFVVCCFKTVCPSGQGDGLEIHWALPAGVRIPSLSSSGWFVSVLRCLVVNSYQGARGCSIKDASAGNRTRVTSMAPMYSTTRPLMLTPWSARSRSTVLAPLVRSEVRLERNWPS